jgi:hypothetical protein
MKIVGTTSINTLLVEVSIEEMRELTCWKNPNSYNEWELDIGEGIHAGKEFSVIPDLRQAKELLNTFRGIAPGLLQSAKRLERLADEVALHEPAVSLLPKKEG